MENDKQGRKRQAAITNLLILSTVEFLNRAGGMALLGLNKPDIRLGAEEEMDIER